MIWYQRRGLPRVTVREITNESSKNLTFLYCNDDINVTRKQRLKPSQIPSKVPFAERKIVEYLQASKDCTCASCAERCRPIVTYQRQLS